MEERIKRLMLFNAIRSYYLVQGMSPNGDFIDEQVTLWLRGIRDVRIHDDMFKVQSLLSELCKS